VNHWQHNHHLTEEEVDAAADDFYDTQYTQVSGIEEWKQDKQDWVASDHVLAFFWHCVSRARNCLHFPNAVFTDDMETEIAFAFAALGFFVHRVLYETPPTLIDCRDAGRACCRP
jgi:hypothetical protein